jgi:hypothetical protein
MRHAHDLVSTVVTLENASSTDACGERQWAATYH